MIKTWLITGDTHGSLKRFDVLKEYKEDSAAIIVLGDVAFNYMDNLQDIIIKSRANKYKNYIYCIRGNHEMRPEDVKNMELVWDNNVNNYVYYEPEYNYIRYLKDGYIYKFGKYKALIIGGAYSVDKYYRLALGRKWFSNEQLTLEEMNSIYNIHKDNTVDFVLSHTCPLSWQPTDLFLNGVNQNSVDNSMEVWMDKLKDVFNWNVWLFGHYHQNRLVRPHVEMLFTQIKNLDDIYNKWNSCEETILPHLEMDLKFYSLDNPWIKKEENKWKSSI